MTSYAHLSSPLGFRQVVELSKHPKKAESHLPAVHRTSVGTSNLAEDTRLARTHIEQIKHIFAKAKDEEDIKRSVPQLKHRLEEIRKIGDKVLKENPGLKDKEKWERLHEDAVKYHELVDDEDFGKLRRSLKMDSHMERETPSTHEERTMYVARDGNVSDTPFMNRGPRRITHDRNSKPGKDFDEAMREAHRQKTEDARWGKAAKDLEVEKKDRAEMDRLRKEEELRKKHEKWRGKGALTVLNGKTEDAVKGASETKKGLSLAHKLALGAGGVATAGALGWATKGRGKKAADAVRAAERAAHKGWSTAKKKESV